jgi:hypothetical protein
MTGHVWAQFWATPFYVAITYSADSYSFPPYTARSVTFVWVHTNQSPNFRKLFSALRHSRFHSEYYNYNLFGTLYGVKDKCLTSCLSVRALPSVIIYGRLIRLSDFREFWYRGSLQKFVVDLNGNRSVTVIFYIETSMSFYQFFFCLFNRIWWFQTSTAE